MTRTRTLLTTTLAIATAITLASCASDTSSGMEGMQGMDRDSTSSTAADVNDQDRAFAQMMKPHHEQAVEMADVLLAKEGISSVVSDLATAIKAAQQPEIAQLDEWISAWGDGSMADMDHGMDGMMSDDDMDALDSASGAEAETLFLEQMTAHHEGAVEMARAEIDGGRNADAIAMATDIVSTQTAEIETMQGLLADR